jgi:hypothetical protein
MGLAQMPSTARTLWPPAIHAIAECQAAKHAASDFTRSLARLADFEGKAFTASRYSMLRVTKSANLHGDSSGRGTKL